MTERAKELVRMPDVWVRPTGRVAEAEFEAVFRGHYEGVYRLLFRLLGSRDEAEDLAQEAFLRYYRGEFAADRPHNLRAWLYRVALNLAHNTRRGDARRAGREVRGEREGLVAPAEDPADAAERGQERAAVRRALARLPERQARLLLLRHSGLSYRELAAALELAPTSVGTLLARAEAAFARAYAADHAPAIGGKGNDL
jgi:RNA polymerase sigma-70 factor (ECF subfamily)